MFYSEGGRGHGVRLDRRRAGVALRGGPRRPREELLTGVNTGCNPCPQGNTRRRGYGGSAEPRFPRCERPRGGGIILFTPGSQSPTVRPRLGDRRMSAAKIEALGVKAQQAI